MGPYFSVGNYVCEVRNQGFGEAKEKKTPFFFLEIQPMQRLHDDGSTEDLDVSYTRVVRWWLTDKTKDRVTKELLELGWTGGKWSTLDPESSGSYSFVAQTLTFQCTHESRSDKPGELQERWGVPYAGSTLTNDVTVARKLDNLFGPVKRAAPEKSKPVAATSAPKRSNGTDDIPF